RVRVAKFIAAIAEHFWTGMAVRWIEANGLPAVALLRGDAVVAVATVMVSAGRIDRLLWVMRPSKLEGVARTLAG
ncbi:MAG TPA: RNA polymerase subunit sigma-24, partial [Phycisphaerae bacterium]|nr:RNA polymerase subunit sigma-24 [Phycisphaerae bacterium]